LICSEIGLWPVVNARICDDPHGRGYNGVAGPNTKHADVCIRAF